MVSGDFCFAQLSLCVSDGLPNGPYQVVDLVLGLSSDLSLFGALSRCPYFAWGCTPVQCDMWQVIDLSLSTHTALLPAQALPHGQPAAEYRGSSKSVTLCSMHAMRCISWKKVFQFPGAWPVVEMSCSWWILKLFVYGTLDDVCGFLHVCFQFRRSVWCFLALRAHRLLVPCVRESRDLPLFHQVVSIYMVCSLTRHASERPPHVWLIAHVHQISGRLFMAIWAQLTIAGSWGDPDTERRSCPLHDCQRPADLHQDPSDLVSATSEFSCPSDSFVILRAPSALSLHCRPFPELDNMSLSKPAASSKGASEQTIYVCSFGLDNFELAAGVKHGDVHRRIRYHYGGDVMRFDVHGGEDHSLLVKQLKKVTDLQGWSSSKVLWIDGRVFSDPARDRALNDHVGSHPQTMKSILRNRNLKARRKCGMLGL